MVVGSYTDAFSFFEFGLSALRMLVFMLHHDPSSLSIETVGRSRYGV